ncbi:hypothetical protein [Rathayibacter rathayi]|uniref:hypothetical protein n=1 Tax=Rathayibacter rathayi TaxID=33887 RepID=UPI000BE2E045|nr:hypothetical protein [Rathayibacter rathayi]AZZ49166.1 hypothetical protein C1O28_08110 [Rathayibacter rathayi]MWV73225.1 hypothetical protein [Rathayibacter rathayi NCPPB 2980 = VKM Ac-1601]PPF51889.1 hypothetical protein C5C08_00600 [Rathayibacter rathayi]PPG72526.1 hypothetical protein C5C16_00780 [Rathayibacter rathayi]PPG81164.1 hypothetical protein C5C15_00605 [Rathayibacter rathayi]
MTSSALASSPLPHPLPLALSADTAPLGTALAVGRPRPSPGAGSLVLVPLRAGLPVGSLRFTLSGAGPELVAQACLGALGRFGRIQRAIALVHSDDSDPEPSARLVLALRERARSLPALSLRVAVVPRPYRDQGFPETEREDTRAVVAAVDRLLDRHPDAALPRILLLAVDDLVRRALRDHDARVRPAGLAALIVAVQCTRGADRLLLLVREGADLSAGSLVPLLRRAAAAAPLSERAGVLVVLGRLLAGDGQTAQARHVAHQAVALDPHHLGARRLASALAADRQERAV